MAIALDAAVGTLTKEDVTPVASLSHSHTCSGSDRYLIAYVWTNTSTNNVSGVTYNSVAMTKLAAVSGGGHELQAWGLASPSTGANNIVASFPSNTLARIGGISYTGAVGGVTVTNTYSLTTAPYSVTTTTDACWLVLFKSAGQSTAGTGATFRFSDSGADNRFSSAYDSNGSTGTAGSKSISCSGTNLAIVMAVSPTAATSVKDIISSGFIPFAR